MRGLIFLGFIFLGVLTLNIQRASTGSSVTQILSGVVPVMVAAVAYPVGNQLLNRAKHAGDEASVLLSDPVAAVLLLTLGALPVFVILILLFNPPLPGVAQVGATALIALVAGCLATTLFLYARNLSRDPLHIAAVDATQAAEVAFALFGEMLMLGAAPPDLLGWVGLVAVIGGLIGFTFQSTEG
ncbi:multidrug resistance efflux transporter family protein [Komagataeibacter rhaeticus]